MRDHIDKSSKIILGLESLELEVDDEDKAILYLNSFSYVRFIFCVALIPMP